MFFPIIISACLLVSGHAQICCSPDQWEATEVTIGGFSFGHHHSNKKIKLMSYDAENNRTAVRENVTSFFGGEKRMHTISDYNEMKEYEINLDDESCDVSDIREEFDQICIEDSDTLENSGTLGLGSDAINILTYKKKTTGFFAKPFFMTVTAAECVPVLKTPSSGLFGHSKTTYYMDITAGIVDINVFTPPEYCSERARMERVLKNSRKFQKL